MKTSTQERQQRATFSAIQMIAYATARDATGQRKKDAIKHCEKLGIDPSAATLEHALAGGPAA